MKSFNFLDCGKYFTVINSELVSVEIERVHIFYHEEKIVYEVISSKDGESLMLDSKTLFYENVDEFKLGCAAEPNKNLHGCQIKNHLRCEETPDGKLSGWIFNEKIAECVSFELSIIIYSRNGFHFNGFDEYENRIPQRFYDNRQAVLDNNVYKVINEDGSVTEEVGLNLQLKLTEEQQRLAEDFKNALNALRDSGVSLVFNDGDCALYAFNNQNIGRLTQVYDGYNDDEVEVTRTFDTSHMTDLDAPVDFTAYDMREVGICKEEA